MSEDLTAIRKGIEDQLHHCLIRDRMRIKQDLPRLFPPKNEEAVWRKLDTMRSRLQQSCEIVEKRRLSFPRISYPEDLPIAQRREEILEAIRNHPIIVIAGETGSGKTTQIPKMCLEAGYGIKGRIACTQPRRVAAMSVSRRIAEELNVPWGKQVGCKMRFSDDTSPETLIKMMTDGIFLQEIQTDPLLSEYDCVIIDEAHERSLNIDFILGYLRQIRSKRPDLKIIITSATIDTESFSTAFDNAPIIEVSGRMYPVDIIYSPLDQAEEETGDLTYIEAAVRAVENIINQRMPGDILIFMPGEKDIRETRDLLDGRRLGTANVLPLFGRMSNAEQQKIFAASEKRRIVIATNVAETSITIPGIRFVIDTGLARISRYSPHTRTQRLPIESIAQSSARQRAGRCGRVADGICIRLYSEDDFNKRDAFTPPEILRSNLAAVILRMMAFRLGQIESFPFIEPPTERSIRGGYQLLKDLGALDDHKQLTPIGRQLAKLPIDPTVGRMLLEAKKEGAIREVLVIAAGLSIQDPRERPADKRDEAEQMHRKFVHPESDFLSLLNIWQAYHDETERLSQSQLRKFCHSHFVSYLRMREWRDIHRQLETILQEMGIKSLSEEPADYDAIHRCILAGSISNVAQKDQGNHYFATHSRKVMLFPGSTLFDQKTDRKQQGGKKSGKDQSKTPEWIMAGEWVETSRLFARTVARIEKKWILDLAGHLLKSTYAEPGWDSRTQRVAVRERLLLYGLEIDRRQVGYGLINPEEATDIFIRCALVENDVRDKFKFLEHNIAMRQRVEELQTRTRKGGIWALDDRLFDFYKSRLPHVSTVADLHKILRKDEKLASSLFITEDILLGNDLPDHDQRYPDAIEVNGERLPLEYNYKPGDEADGVTLKIPLAQFESLNAGIIDWVVPAYVEEKVSALLRSLPKGIRKQLFPINDRIPEIMSHLRPEPRPMTEQLTEVLYDVYKIRVSPADWNEEVVPEYLKPRVEIVDTKRKTLVAERSWNRLEKSFKDKVEKEIRSGRGMDNTSSWKKMAARLEKHGLQSWSFGDPPESVQIGEINGIPITAWTGLEKTEDGISLRLFRTRDEALKQTPAGYMALGELALAKDLAWLRKDLKDVARVGTLFVTLGSLDELKEDVYNSILHYIFIEGATLLPLKKADFEKRVEKAREKLRGLLPKVIDLLVNILERRQQLVMIKDAYPGLQNELTALVGKDFVRRYPLTMVNNLPRYLDAKKRRAERYKTNPPKDMERQKEFAPVARQVQEFIKKHPQHPNIPELEYMLEEYRVSVFAQELGTATKVSPKRIQALMEA